MEEIIPAKDAGARRKQAMSADCDFKSGMVVASVWLFLYALTLGGVFNSEPRPGLASMTAVSHK